MSSKKSYSRYFIILQEDDKGHSISDDKQTSGYAKVETKNDKCKVSFYVQNIRRDKDNCYMVLICNKKDSKKLINLGKLNIDDNGRADVTYECGMDNVGNTGIGIDKVGGAAVVKFVEEKLYYIMTGFASSDIPERFKEYSMIHCNEEIKKKEYKKKEKEYEEDHKEKKKKEEHKKHKDDCDEDYKEHKKHKDDCDEDYKEHKKHKDDCDEEHKEHKKHKDDCEEEHKEHKKHKDDCEEEHKKHKKHKECCDDRDQKSDEQREASTEDIINDEEIINSEDRGNTEETTNTEENRSIEDNNKENLFDEYENQIDEIKEEINGERKEKVSEQEKQKILDKQKMMEKIKELEKQKELDKQKMLDKIKELEKQKELDKQKALEKIKELEMQKGEEQKKALEKIKELEKQKEMEMQKESEMQKELKQKEMEMQKELEKQKEMEMQMKKEEEEMKMKMMKESHPKGSMGEFFKAVMEGFEELKGGCKEIKRCRWYKVPVKNLDTMCNSHNYNKYTIVYYPMMNYYPYIKKHDHYMMGLMCDDHGNMKYLVYAIPGRRDKADQPYGGKSGFVTWMPWKDHHGKESNMGYWMMFYDFKNSIIVVPMK
ncbi:hypothetical protein [Clostridium sp.]|uniref:DUF7922 domain-containing protein n=1 Tax=Clostridium sp. TaxID=1506 RepID=UPI003463E22A